MGSIIPRSLAPFTNMVSSKEDMDNLKVLGKIIYPFLNFTVARYWPCGFNPC